MRVLGYLFIVGGVASLGLAVFLLTQTGFNVGFLAYLVAGCGAIAGGFNLILQSKGLMD